MMAKVAAENKKRNKHFWLDAESAEILEAIADEMDRDPVQPRPTDGQQLNKAVRLYIEACRAKSPELAAAIRAVEERRAETAKIVRCDGSVVWKVHTADAVRGEPRASGSQISLLHILPRVSGHVGVTGFSAGVGGDATSIRARTTRLTA